MLLTLLYVYLVIGIAFALWFQLEAVTLVDPDLRRSAKIVRFILFPGSVILWPLMLGKYILAKRKNDVDKGVSGK